MLCLHPVLSETITVDGKLRPGLPPRRMLWDVLKPQASAVSTCVFECVCAKCVCAHLYNCVCFRERESIH